MTAIDSKQLPDWGPFQVKATLYPDWDSSTDDADCYTPKQVEAWRNDEWSFVGLEVTVSFNGREIGSNSLWGIEHGHYTMTDEDDNVTGEEYLNPLSDEQLGDWWSDVIEGAKLDAVATIEQLQAVEIPT